MGQLTGLHVVSLVGRQGSGKSFLGGKLSALLNAGRLEVSDVVRATTSIKERAELPATALRTLDDPTWLGRAITEGLIAARDKVGGKQLVILTGARETEIHKYLRLQGATIRVVEINCNPFTRCERLIRLHKVVDEHEFLTHEARESKMGIVGVLEERYARVITTDTSDPDDLMKKLMASLKSKGVV